MSAVSRVDDPHVLVAADDVPVGRVFHRDPQGIFPGGHALVDQAGAVEDLGIVDELLQALPAVELVQAVDLGIGGARLLRVGEDHLALPFRQEEVLPCLGHVLVLDQGLVDHDDHHVGIAGHPAAVLFHVARREAFPLRGPVGLEIFLRVFQDRDVAAPEDIAQGLVLFRGDPLHRFTRSQADDGNLDARLRFETLADEVEELRGVRGVQYDLRRHRRAGKKQGRGKNGYHSQKTSAHKITSW